MSDMNELLQGLQGFTPQAVEDVDFEPIKGAYEARVDGITRKTGEKDGRAYDFYSFNIQITNTIEGDKADNRFLNKTYNMILSEYTNPQDEFKRLITDLFTCGISYDTSSPEALEASFAAAKDNTVKVRTWVRTGKDGNKYQSMKFVKELKVKEGSKKSPF